MIQTKITKYFAVYTNELDSPSPHAQSPRKPQVNFVIQFWPVQKHMYIYTHLRWLYIQLIRGESKTRKKRQDRIYRSSNLSAG